jgi:PAS domain S-box-containing protein
MDNNHHIESSRLREIIQTAPFPIGVYTGHELKIEVANARMIETYGKGDGVLGKSYTEILPELGSQQIFDQLRQVLVTGTPYHAKNQRVDIAIAGALTPHYFNYSFTPLFDAEGSIYGVMNTAADVTDLNLARQQSAEADQKLRLAIEAAELGTYEIDLGSGSIATSGNFNKIWDLESPVTQQEILSRIHPEDAAIREQAHRNVDTKGQIFYELRIIHRDGTVRWLKINGKYTTDSLGKNSALMGITQDITDQKRSAQELEKLVSARTAALNRSNEDLLQFAHVISHDLKEPVRKISVFNDILEKNYAAQIEQDGLKYIKKVKAATDRMARMIDGVLMYSTINAAGYPAEKVDLNTIIENILIDLELTISEKKAKLSVEGLPVVEGSPILLHQLCYNLISNALKFSRENEPPLIRILSDIKKNDSQPYVAITISDNGIGFDDIYTERIFNVFERLHSKDAYEGTGLGLALCRKIAERHNGTLTAAGRPGQGADFTLTLPLLQLTEKL